MELACAGMRTAIPRQRAVNFEPDMGCMRYQTWAAEARLAETQSCRQSVDFDRHASVICWRDRCQLWTQLRKQVCR